MEKICINCTNKKARTSKYFCSKCYRKDLYKRRPDIHEKEKLRNIHRVRKKKGLPLDFPLMRKPAGSGYITPAGYKVILKPGHPNCTSKHGLIGEHTYIMSEYLGRPLIKGESVHHKNGIRHDNRLENLELWDKRQPTGQRVKDKIKFYKEFLEQYGAKVDLSSVSQIFYDNES